MIKSKTSTATNIKQRYLVVSYAQKVDALTRILEVEEFDGVIVFVRTKNETETLAEKLRARGYSAAAINGDIPQAMRERTIGQLKDGTLDILVATDVAARGLDVDRISHVINFDIPTDTESYVHRVGRTCRAGRSGDASSFVTPRERRLLSSIERATRQTLSPMTMPTAEDINATRLGRFDDAITAKLSSDQLGQFRDIFSHIILPASLLGYFSMAYISRMTRSFMLNELGQEYIVAARAKGLSESRIIWGHALRNAAVPLVTVIALSYAGLLEGSVLTETVFAWPGLGLYITNSLQNADMNAVLGGTIVIGSVFIAINLLSDVLYRMLDPRTRTR